MMPDERREDTRTALARPVKLQSDRTAARYLAGWSRDISAGGMLIELTGQARFEPGQRVQVGVAVTPRQALLRRRQMVEAVVVRSLGHGERQHLALRFTERQRLALAG